MQHLWGPAALFALTHVHICVQKIPRELSVTEQIKRGDLHILELLKHSNTAPASWFQAQI